MWAGLRNWKFNYHDLRIPVPHGSSTLDRVSLYYLWSNHCPVAHRIYVSSCKVDFCHAARLSECSVVKMLFEAWINSTSPCWWEVHWCCCSVKQWHYQVHVAFKPSRFQLPSKYCNVITRRKMMRILCLVFRRSMVCPWSLTNQRIGRDGADE